MRSVDGVRTDLELIRDDINALPPGLMTILGGRAATENPRYWLVIDKRPDVIVDCWRASNH